MKRLGKYLNPIARLGLRRYSVFFPLLSSIALSIFSEIVAYYVVDDPESTGIYIIFVSIAAILYFSFRDGIRGGLTTSSVSILYYFYIINARHYTGAQLQTSTQTIFVLAALYFLLSFIIGWLKQKIDTLIIHEADERRRLQSIIQQLPVGVVITDSKGKVEHTNKQLEKTLGIKMPKGLVAGRDVIIPIQYNGKDVDATQSPIAKTLSIGKDIMFKEYMIDRPDGKKVTIQVSTSIIRNKEEKVIAAAAIVRDVTEQKEMEIRKDDFVNMASHELKTPITSMKLYIDLLIQRVIKHEDEKTLKIITSLKGQTQRLQELVSDLLDVSRIQTGKLNFHKEQFRLDDIIKETVEAVQGTIDSQKLIFKKHPKMEVYADKFRIYQVLTNLLTNAIKYSPGDGVIIVSVKKDGNNARVSVSDRGIGIAKREQKKIFDRLYQVTDPKEKTFPGLGMGLYISREIIKRHKGKIWVESEKGKGSTFFFTLPLS